MMSHYFTWFIGSASLARSIRIRFHFRHRTGRIRSVSDHRAGRVWRSRHRSKTPNCLPGARDQVPALFRNASERRGASVVGPNSGAPITQSTWICCDAWPIRYHYWTDDCMNIITSMAMHYFKCKWKMTIYFFHTRVTLQMGTHLNKKKCSIKTTSVLNDRWWMTGPALFIYLLMYIRCPFFVHSLIEFHFYASY